MSRPVHEKGGEILPSILGRGGETDPRTDLYAVSLVLKGKRSGRKHHSFLSFIPTLVYTVGLSELSHLLGIRS